MTVYIDASKICILPVQPFDIPLDRVLTALYIYPWDVALTKMTDVINIQFFELFNVKHVI